MVDRPLGRNNSIFGGVISSLGNWGLSIVMVRSTTTTAGKSKLVVEKRSALSGYCYQNGYVFSVTDLGKQGVKIELVHEYGDGRAIILPPAKAEECAKWLLRTIGQIKHSPLKELCDILQRLMREKSLGRILHRGDKKKIREAVRLLKIQQS
jgi:hypothetical protein